MGYAEKNRWNKPELARTPITGERYTTDQFMELEWEHIWTKVWLLVGRAPEIPKSGDFLVENIGPESFLIIRQNDGSVRTFYNVCRHRGSRLVMESEGNIKDIQCPLCGLAWNLSGQCKTLSNPANKQIKEEMRDLALNEVRNETHAGFIFITMNENPVPLRKYLGPVWDDWANYHSDKWTRTSAATVAVDCNWKVPQDNSCESYHLPTVHPQGEYWIEHDYKQCIFDWCDEGHNRMAIKMGTPAKSLQPKNLMIDEQLAAMLLAWGLNPQDFRGREYETRSALQKAKREKAGERGYDIEDLDDDQLTDAYHYNIFPNITISYAGCEYVSMQRMRPHSTDPTKCFYDNFTYGAKGSESDADLEGLGGKEWLHEGRNRQFFTYGDRLMNRRIADQDLSIVTGQQLGLASRGYVGVTLSGQEGRVQRFHDVINEHISAGS